MNLFSYVVTRDYGFAPNPFYGICSLATCMPVIRRKANVGDWVIGTGSKTKNLQGRLVYAMKVSEKISFDQYWHDDRFRNKKPNVFGSLKQTYGDNIYHLNNENEWCQENSHHSNEDGTINLKNFKKDTGANAVLISNEFYYFGKNTIEIPAQFRNKVSRNLRMHMNIDDTTLIDPFIEWLTTQNKTGYHGDPRLFDSFKRFKG